MKPTILVLGGNFGGMTSAFELKRKLGATARILVISKTREFLYIPSLIWVPFGRRKVADITFSAEDTLRRGGIDFILDEATRIDAAASGLGEFRAGTVAGNQRHFVSHDPTFPFRRAAKQPTLDAKHQRTLGIHNESMMVGFDALTWIGGLWLNRPVTLQSSPCSAASFRRTGSPNPG